MNFFKKKLFLILNLISPKMIEKLRFFYHQRYIPNIDNPVTFSEKLIHRKLMDYNSSFSLYSDKIKAKQLIGDIIGEQYIIKTLKVLDKATIEDLLSVELPFVVKCNHDSGSVKIIKSKDQINKKLVESLNNRLNYSISKNTNEYWYDEIDRKILVETFISCDENQVPEDYKFHVFTNSNEVFLQVDYGRFQEHTRTFYNEKNEIINLSIGYKNYKYKLGEVKNISEMFGLARMIASHVNVPYLRVDLYNVDGNIYFGEVTFTHGAGFEKFNNIEMDRYWGCLWG